MAMNSMYTPTDIHAPNGFVTSTGFGVSADGAIGFAEDIVYPTTATPQVPVTTATASAAGPGSVDNNNEADPGMYTTNREAQRFMRYAFRSSPSVKKGVSSRIATAASAVPSPPLRVTPCTTTTATAATTTHNASSINAFVYKGVTGKTLTKSPAHNVVDLFSSLPGKDGYIPKSAYNGKNAKYTKAEVKLTRATQW